jgi:hypothetical protein
MRIGILLGSFSGRAITVGVVTSPDHRTVFELFSSCKTSSEQASIPPASFLFTCRLQTENRAVTGRWDHSRVEGKSSPRRITLTLAALAAAALAAAGPALGDPPGGHGKKPKGNPHAVVDDKAKQTSKDDAKPVVSPPVKANVQGVVQAVWPTGALVRLLDGSTVNITPNHDTHLFVDGKPSQLNSVRPGYVLTAIIASGHTTILRFVRPA